MHMFLIAFLIAWCSVPALLSAQTPTLPPPPQQATSTATGFHDSFTRCQQALTAAKALLPRPTANHVAYYGIVRLHHEGPSASCTATVAVVFQFRFPSPTSKARQSHQAPSWVQIQRR